MPICSNPFSVKKAKPRKQMSRSPLKLVAEEVSRELGPVCSSIDVRIADKNIAFDINHGDWKTAGAETISGAASSSSAQKIRKQVEILKEENNMLKLKVDVLLNLVAESVAELTPGSK